MFKPRNKTDDLLLSITKNCETLTDQRHKKPQKILKFELSKSKFFIHSTYSVTKISDDWFKKFRSV